MKKTISILFLLFSTNATSCSIAGNLRAEFDYSSRNSGIQPGVPTAKVGSIIRGGQMVGSCNDIAVLTIKIPVDKINPAFAYKFKLVSGDIYEGAFENYPVKSSINNGEYTFVFSWLEYQATPLNAKVSITAYSKSGKRSKAFLLDIPLVGF